MKRKQLIIILLIVAVAFATRLFGISYGLPYLYLEDEEFFVQPALHVAEGNLNPGWFGAPGQPLIYALAIVFRVTSFVINAVHNTSNPVAINYQDYISIFQTVGRIIPMLAGTAMALLAFAIGRLWNFRAGAISGLLTAGSFYFIDHSHIIRPDILQMAFLLFALWCVYRMLQDPHAKRWYIFSGVSMGLAITTKFPSIVFILPGFVLLYLLFKDKKLIWKNWGYGVLAVFITAFVSAPFLFLDPVTAGADILKEASSQHGGHDGLGFFGNLWWYIGHVLVWQIGTFLYAFGFAGVVMVVVQFFHDKREIKNAFFIICFVALFAYLLFVSSLSLHWERWIIPVAALLMLFVGIGLDQFFRLFKDRKSVIVTVLVIAVFAPAVRTIRTITGFAIPHTEDVAREWIGNHISPNASFAQEPHTVELPSIYRLEKFANMTVHSPEWFRENGFTHYIISGGVHGIIEQEAERYGEWTNYGHAVKLYGQLFSQSEKLFEVKPHPIFTSEDLLYSNDFTVLQTLDIKLMKGHYQRVYEW